MINISERDFRGLDLNLLIPFLVLMRERSVSRASQKLHLGQPAVSGVLSRLRELFEDDLFIRTAQGMVPTARAHDIARALAPALQAVHDAVQSPVFNLAESERVFTLGMPDWVEMWLMPELLSRLRAVAPKVRVAVKSTDRIRATKMLEQDEMDLGIAVLDKGPSWRRSQELVSMNYSCVYHPDRVSLARPLTLTKYLKHPHLFISYQGDFEGMVDAKLADLGKRRSVIYSTPHFGTLPFLLGSLPAFATVPELLAASWSRRFGLRFAPVPVPLPNFSLSLSWHAQRETEGALRWMSQLLEDVARDKPGVGPLAPGDRISD